MKASLYHVQVNVVDPMRSLPFYRDLLTFLEYTIVSEGDDHLGAWGPDRSAALWIVATGSPYRAAGFHRKRPGLNHVAFRVGARVDVDTFTRQFLDARRLPTIYGPPRDYPEYRPGYYAVFFEDPDRLKLEVVHIP
jgi:glyoxylase I family protein